MGNHIDRSRHGVGLSGLPPFELSCTHPKGNEICVPVRVLAAHFLRQSAIIAAI